MALTDKLTAIADAIRGKTGGTDTLTLDEMPGEIEGIETGGGEDTAVALLCKTITAIDSEQPTAIEQYLFYKCTALETVNLPNVTGIGQYAFYYCTALETVNLPNVVSLEQNVFAYCKFKNELVMENLTSIAIGTFRGVTMPKAKFPKLATIAAQAFRYNAATVGIFDLPVCTEIGIANFDTDYKSVCSHLILRADSVCAISTINDGIQNVYVPSALIEEYKVATNWVDLYTSNPDIFHALEDYTVDGTTTGEFDESKI